jgi:inner membrane transporter RhtA
MYYTEDRSQADRKIRLNPSKDQSHDEAIPAVSSRTLAVLLVLVQIISLQLGAVLATGLASRVGGISAATLRMTFAALVAWAVVRPNVRLIRREDLPLIVGFGCVLAVMNASFFEAISRLPLGVATTLEFIGPLVVILVSARRARDRAWGLVAAAGVMLLTWHAGHLDRWGLLCALMAAAARSLYILGSKRVGQRYSNADGLCYALIVGCVVALPFGMTIAGQELLQPDVLLVGLVVAVLSSAIPYLCDLFSLRRLPSHTFGVLISMGPAVGALAGFLLLGQQISLSQSVGVALVVGASVGALTAGPDRDFYSTRPLSWLSRLSQLARRVRNI